MKAKNFLVGKFVFVGKEEYYKTGEIVASIDDHAFAIHGFVWLSWDLKLKYSPAPFLQYSLD